ncbi:MAG: hypothetical protein FJX76_08165 [Armatimonadetes bacterium]|nr:hypothetical protein [Armatimonadota bacterium]
MSDILHHLRTAGELDSQGHFSLDKRKAQDKMREFQLVDAHDYVLKLIQAAVAGGATKIEVTADAASVTLLCHGWTLERALLEQPFDGLFIAQESVDGAFLRHLAIGLNAALALQPERLEVWSGGAAAVVPESAADRLSVVEQPAPSSVPRDATRFVITERVSWRMAGRAMQNLVGDTPEGAAVRARARLSPIPVTLNGEPVADGKLAAPDGVQASVTFAGETCAGVVWSSGIRPERGTVSFIKAGVKICDAALDLPPLQASAMVRADGVLTNASESDVVEDASLDGVIAAVRAANEALLQKLVAEYRDGNSERRRGLRPTLLHVLAARDLKTWEDSPSWDALKALAIFEIASGDARSVGDFQEVTRAGQNVYYHMRGALELVPIVGYVIARVDGAEKNALSNLLGDRFRPIAGETRILQRALNMSRWNAKKKGVPRLRAGVSYMQVVSFNERGFSGELGIGRRQPERTQACVRFFLQEQELAEEREDLDGLVFDAVINHNKFAANYTYDGIEHDALWKEAREFLAERFAQAVAALATDVTPPHPDVREVAEHVIDLLHYQKKNYEKPDLPEAIGRYGLFPTVARRFASLADLTRDLEEFGAVHYVRKVEFGPQLDHRQIVKETSDDLIDILKFVFDPSRVTDYSKKLAAERAMMENMQRPAELPQLGGRAYAPVDIRQGDILGALGLTLPEDMPKTRPFGQVPTQVRFLRGGKPIETKTVTLQFGPVLGVIDSPRLQPNQTWDAVEEDEAYQEALQALRGGADDLARVVAAEVGVISDWRAPLIREFLLGYLCWKRSEIAPAVRDARLFAVAGGGVWSLQDLQDELAKNGNLRFVSTFFNEAPSDRRPAVFFSDEPARRALQAWFDGVWVDYTDDLKEQIARESFLRRPTVPARLPARERFAAIVEMEPPWHGELGLIEDVQGFDGRVSIRVMRAGRFLDTVNNTAALPYEAVLDADDTPVNRSWSGLSGPATQTVMAAANAALERAVAAVAASAGSGRPEQNCLLLRYLFVGGMSLEKMRREGLLGEIAARSLFEDSTGKPMSVLELASAFQSEKKLLFVRPGVKGQPRDGCRVVRLSEAELVQLKRVFRTAYDYTDDLKIDETARKNQEAARRVEDIELPGGTYVAIIPMKGRDMKGELALVPGKPPGVTLVCRGLAVETRPFFDDVPVIGVVSSPGFEPNRVWDKVVLNDVHRRGLDDTLDALMARCAQKATEDAGVRGALLAWYVLRRGRITSGGKFGDVVNVALFPLANGQVVPLKTLVGAFVKRGHVLTCKEAMETEGDPVVLARDAEIRTFLHRFFGEAAVKPAERPKVKKVQRDGFLEKMIEAVDKAADRLEEKADALQAVAQEAGREREKEQRAREAVARKEEMARREAERKAAKKKLREEPPPPPDPRQQEREALLRLLRDCFTQLAWRQQQRWQNHILERIRIVDGPSGVVVTCDGSVIDLNARHPLLAGDLRRYHGDRGAVARLASAIFTAMNQARTEITDDDEIRFLEDLCDWVLNEQSA